jgi:hypothetical protein
MGTDKEIHTDMDTDTEMELNKDTDTGHDQFFNVVPVFFRNFGQFFPEFRGSKNYFR